MDDLERRQTEMVWRVGSFGTENSVAIQTNSKAVAAFATIQTMIAQLEAKGIARSSAGETKLSQSIRRKLHRNELYDDLSLISQTAAQIARDNPDFINKYRLPQTNRNDLTWIETARAFAVDLVADKQLFLDYGMPDDFIEDLIADTDDFEAAINEQDDSNRDRIGANADIDEIIDTALRAVRTLKVIIPNLFKGNPGKLADWASASHVEKPAKRTPKPV